MSNAGWRDSRAARRGKSTLWLSMFLVFAGVPARAQAQGADVTIDYSAGQTIRGELLVATQASITVMVSSPTRNFWWKGDSAFAVLLPLSGIERIIVEGSSYVLVGAGIGLVLGAGIGALSAERHWEGQGAAVLGVIGALAGSAAGGLASHRQRVFERTSPGGFIGLSDHARFGEITPAILRHIKPQVE